MAGVYIKSDDFLFPQDCNHCILCVQCTGEKYRRCEITYRPIRGDMDKRQKWCPLIAVPDHGRLIDAEELVKRWTAPSEYYPDNYSKSVYDNGKLSVKDFRASINDAPTIIPAEEVQDG